MLLFAAYYTYSLRCYHGQQLILSSTHGIPTKPHVRRFSRHCSLNSKRSICKQTKLNWQMPFSTTKSVLKRVLKTMNIKYLQRFRYDHCICPVCYRYVLCWIDFILRLVFYYIILYVNMVPPSRLGFEI
jgi:hypothetical protein